MAITSDEFDQLKNLMRIVVEEVIDQKLLEKIGNLPTKDEFYQQTLKILKNQEDLEIEKDLLSAHSSEHFDRLEKLEKIHPDYQHP